MRTMELGVPLYKKGEMANHFYFLVRGQLHLTVVESQNTKMSLTIEENSFFGFRESSAARNDFATSKNETTEVIQIDTRVYRSLITQTQLQISLEKLEFLMRFVPHLRDEDQVGYEKLQSLEHHF